MRSVARTADPSPVLSTVDARVAIGAAVWVHDRDHFARTRVFSIADRRGCGGLGATSKRKGDEQQ